VFSRRAAATFSWRGGLAAVLAELQSQIPGTRALVTVADVPGKNIQGIGGDEPVFADKEVLYHGHLIAIVLHANVHQAALAAELAATFLDYAPIRPSRWPAPSPLAGRSASANRPISIWKRKPAWPSRTKGARWFCTPPRRTRRTTSRRRRPC
jgi:hypothetical protein